MSWKMYRVIHNTTFVNKINKVYFVQLNDVEYVYDDTLELNFNKYKQEGIFDINNGVVSITGNNLKVMLEINLFYKYNDTDFAPRYELNIYKNEVLLNKHYCGLNDNVHTDNNLYLVSVLDVQNDDKIKITISKDSLENSTSKISILKNSYVNYKTF